MSELPKVPESPVITVLSDETIERLAAEIAKKIAFNPSPNPSPVYPVWIDPRYYRWQPNYPNYYQIWNGGNQA
jgi:hypothetical protein